MQLSPYCLLWDEITYPFPNIDGCTIEIWEWISNSIPYFVVDVIIYVSKEPPEDSIGTKIQLQRDPNCSPMPNFSSDLSYPVCSHSMPQYQQDLQTRGVMINRNIEKSYRDC